MCFIIESAILSSKDSYRSMGFFIHIFINCTFVQKKNNKKFEIEL